MCSTIALRRGLKVASFAKRCSFACKECRTILCKACWDLFDHHFGRFPNEEPPKTPSEETPQTDWVAPRCPNGHPLTRRDTLALNGLTCDGCERKLGDESCFSCCLDAKNEGCDHDLCLACYGEPSTADRAKRGAKRGVPDEAEQDEAMESPPKKAKPTRRPSQYARNRAAANTAKHATKAKTAKATKAHTSRREAHVDKLKAARQNKQEKNRRGRGRKRSRSTSRADASPDGDGCDRETRSSRRS